MDSSEYTCVDGTIRFPCTKLPYIKVYLEKRGFEIFTKDDTCWINEKDFMVIKEIEDAEVDAYDIDVWYQKYFVTILT